MFPNYYFYCVPFCLHLIRNSNEWRDGARAAPQHERSELAKQYLHGAMKIVPTQENAFVIPIDTLRLGVRTLFVSCYPENNDPTWILAQFMIACGLDFIVRQLTEPFRIYGAFNESSQIPI